MPTRSAPSTGGSSTCSAGPPCATGPRMSVSDQACAADTNARFAGIRVLQLLPAHAQATDTESNRYAASTLRGRWRTCFCT
jgi:hypothetical protein